MNKFFGNKITPRGGVVFSIIAILVTLIMAFSMFIPTGLMSQVGAFADGLFGGTSNEKEQIKVQGIPVTKDGVTINKTIKKVEASTSSSLENVFDITLDVETPYEFDKYPGSMDIAVVLDLSDSMRWFIDGTAKAGDKNGDEVYPKGTEQPKISETDKTRYHAVKAALKTLLDTYNTKANEAASIYPAINRQVSIIAYNSLGHTITANTSIVGSGTSTTIFNAAEAQLNSIMYNTVYGNAEYYTNMEAGLECAYTQLNQSSADHKAVLFLTDGLPTTYNKPNQAQGLTAYNGWNPRMGGTETTPRGEQGAGKFINSRTSAECTVGTSYSDPAAEKAQDVAVRLKKSVKNGGLGAKIYSVGTNLEKQSPPPTYATSYVGDLWTISKDQENYGRDFVISGSDDTKGKARKEMQQWLGGTLTKNLPSPNNVTYGIGSDDVGDLSFTNCSDTESLKNTFNAIVNAIDEAAWGSSAYVTADPMSDDVEFLGLKKLDGSWGYDVEGTYSYSDTKSYTTDNSALFSNNQISWNLKQSGALRTATGTTPTYKFSQSLTYRIRLKVEQDTFVPTKNLKTNGTTTLTYSTFDSTTGKESELKTMNFKVPEVEGYEGSGFTFYKKDYASGLELGDAEFQLIHDGDISHTDCCEQCKKTRNAMPASSSTIIGPLTSTSSTEAETKGKVAFSNIPSGHTYKLKETNAPDGYIASKDTYTVTCDFGDIHIFDSTGVEVSSGFSVYNEPDEPEKIYTPGTAVQKETDIVKVGDTISYTLYWINSSGAAADVVLTDVMTDGLTYNNDVSPTTPAPTIEGQKLTWNLGTQADGAHGTFSYSATVNEKAIVDGGVENEYTIKVGTDPGQTFTLKNPTPVSFNIPVSKQTLPNTSSGTEVISKNEFTWNFTLSGEATSEEDPPMPDDKSAVIKTTGKTEEGGVAATDDKFGNITFEKDGLYHYKITEDKKDGWNSNPTADIEKDVYVKVENVSSTHKLTITGLYEDSACKKPYDNKIVKFVNTYTNPDPEKKYTETTMKEGDVVSVGDEIGYTLTWRNDLDGTADITCVDKLSKGLTYVEDRASVPPTTKSTDPATGITTITWLFSSQSIGATGNITYKAKVNSEAVAEYAVYNDFIHKVNNNPDYYGSLLNPVKQLGSFEGIKTYKDKKTETPLTFSEGDFTMVVNSTFEGEGATKFTDEEINIVPDTDVAETGKGKWTLGDNRIEFTKVGTYTYSIKEKYNGTRLGSKYVEYDNAQYVVTFNVAEITIKEKKAFYIKSKTVSKNGGTREVYTPTSITHNNFLGEDIKTYNDEHKVGDVVHVGDTIKYKIETGNFTDNDNTYLTFKDNTSVGLELVDTSFTIKVGNADPVTINPTIAENKRSFYYKTSTESLQVPINTDVVMYYEAVVTEDAQTTYHVNNTAYIGVNNDPDIFVGKLTNPIPPDKDYSQDSVVQSQCDVVDVGDEIGYTINWANTTTESVSVSLNDKLSKGLKYVEGTAKTEAGDPLEPTSITKDETTGITTLHWKLADAKPAGTGGCITYKVIVTDEAEKLGSVNNDYYLQFNEEPEVAIKSLHNPTPPKKVYTDEAMTQETIVQYGDVISYTLDWVNPTDNYVELIVYDIPSRGLTYNDDASMTPTENNLKNNLGDGVSRLVWELGVKAPGEYGSIVYSVTVNKEAEVVPGVNNEASLKVGNADPMILNKLENPLIIKDVLNQQGVSINGEEVYIGDTLTYTISVTNKAHVTTNLWIRDWAPDLTTYVAGSAKVNAVAKKHEITGSGTEDDPLIWRVENVESGELITASFDVTVNDEAANQTIYNTAEASFGEQALKWIRSNEVFNPVLVPEAVGATGDDNFGILWACCLIAVLAGATAGSVLVLQKHRRKHSK